MLKYKIQGAIQEILWDVKGLIFATSLIGIYAISSGMEGYMHHHEAIWQRIILIGAGLCMIIPETITDFVGLALIAIIILFQYVIERKKAGSEPNTKSISLDE